MKPLVPHSSGRPAVLSQTDCLEIPSGVIVTSNKTVCFDTFQLADLNNVTLTNPSDGQVLTYDANTLTWINASIASGGATDFLGLSDTPSVYGNVGDLIRISSSGNTLEFFTPNYLADDGSVGLAGDFNFNSYKGINLADPSNDGDAVNFKTLNTCITTVQSNLAVCDSNLQNQIDNINNDVSSLTTCDNCLQSQIDSINTNGVTCAQNASTLDGLDSTCFALVDHNHDTRYYTQDCLNNGILNTLYYTQDCLNNGILNTLYYTQTCLDNGVLDSRYYTETEVDNLLANKSDCNHTHALNDLSNVDVSSVVGGNVLCFDSTTQCWVPGTISSTTPAGTFTDLTDTPSDYTNVCNYIVAVDSTGTGLTFIASAPSADSLNGAIVDDTQTTTSNLWTASKINNTINSANLVLSWQRPVISFYDPTVALPATPATGDRYIASATANGWTENYIYEYNGSDWTEIIPNSHFTLWNESDNKIYTYNGSAWGTIDDSFTHNSLTGLQGNGSDYYHLDSTQYTELTNGGLATIHTHTFLQLLDSPSSYACQGNKVVAVSSAEDALVFVDLSTQYAPLLHNHDTCYYTQTCLNDGVLNTLYYTQAQVDCFLAAKSDCGHTHVWTDIDKTGSSINDLGDVDTTTAAAGCVLCFDGTNWIPATVTSSGSLPAGTNNYDHLEWDATNSVWNPVSTITFADAGMTTTISGSRTLVSCPVISITEAATSCSTGLLYIESQTTDAGAFGLQVNTCANAALFTSSGTQTNVVTVTNSNLNTNITAYALGVDNQSTSATNGGAICAHSCGAFGMYLYHEGTGDSSLKICTPAALQSVLIQYDNLNSVGINIQAPDPSSCAIATTGTIKAGSYITFTGGHKLCVPTTDWIPGLLVKATESIETNNFSKIIYCGSLTSVACDASVLGAFVGYNEPKEDFYGVVIDNPGIVNALGQGKLYVTDEGGDIAIGDFLTSSSREGLAMRQNNDEGNKDAVLRNYTVAKAMQSVDWSTIEIDPKFGYKVKLISVIYLAG